MSAAAGGARAARAPVFVIGLGEVGRRFALALERHGHPVRPVTRAAGWEGARDPGDPAPRVVCVREEDLAAVLERLAGLAARTLLIQNGFLEAVHGDLGPVSRGVIYFTAKGDFFRALAPSPFHGPLAATIVPALGAAGIPAEVVAEPRAFLAAMIGKGVWNSVTGLPLHVHQVDLATYVARHRDELEAVVAEGLAAAGAHYGVEIPLGRAVAKLLETTRELGWLTGGTRALAWRNGAIARLGRLHGVPTPANDRLLRAAGYEI